MSTICKLDPTVRANRTTRRNIRRALASTFDTLMATNKVTEALAVGRVIKRLKGVTNHRVFMARFNEEVPSAGASA